MDTLLIALGSPAPRAGVPTKRSRAWQEIILRLESFSDLQGKFKGKGPVWLWSKLQQRPPPKSMEWGDMLRDWESARKLEVQERLKAECPLTDIHIASWNVRWLTDATTSRAKEKTSIVEQAMDPGEQDMTLTSST